MQKQKVIEYQTSYKFLGFAIIFFLFLSALFIVPQKTEATSGLWVNVGAGLSQSGAYDLSLALDSNNIPYVSYYDDSAPSYYDKANVMKFDGTNWVSVGIAGFSAGGAYSTSLKLDSADTPYLAYSDAASSSKATVMKFNGTSWVNVGTPGFSAGSANFITLALDSSNIPYVAYPDGASSSQATVMKFNGTSWVNVGTPGFSAGGANHTFLAIDSANTPYVAYQDAASSSKVTVMKFNGTSWVNVGTPAFSAGGANFISLALDSANIPYVAYKDNANSNKATVMKFDGTNWVNVGTAGFSPGGTESTSLALDSSDTPYVAFTNYADGDKATVMKFAVPIITSYSGSFTENGTDDGSLGGSRIVTLANDTFVNAGGTLTEGVHYTLTNKPAGLTAVMNVSGGGTITTLTFSGNATNHATANNVSNLTITFLDGAFTNTLVASDVVNYTDNTGVITFITLSHSSGGGGGGGGSRPPPIVPPTIPPTDCRAGDLFSQSTGAPCPAPNPNPLSCRAGDLFSSLTGERCNFLLPPLPQPPFSHQFTYGLTLGSTGEEVRQLQIFLNTHGFQVALTGLGSPGNESYYFGTLTKSALSRFQSAHGILPSVGYFGPITRAFINAMHL